MGPLPWYGRNKAALAGSSGGWYDRGREWRGYASFARLGKRWPSRTETEHKTEPPEADLKWIRKP